MTSAKGKERPAEQPAARTAIVGGRPPGAGKQIGDIPRGIEVLVKKAAVDADFKALLLARRAAAASDIGLALEPAEAAMLDGVPAAQLEAIIARTTVSPMSRAAFLGKAAAVMLAALGPAIGSNTAAGKSYGIRGDVPAPAGDTRERKPDRPGRERFVLYTETNWRGEQSCGIVSETVYDEKATTALKTNRALRPAYVAASKEWSKDDATRNTAFPMKMPRPLQCSKIATYTDRDRAEEMLKRWQDKLDRKAEQAQKAEERRFAALSEQARAKEKAEQLKAAQALFERELSRILEGGKSRAIDLRRRFNTGGGEASEGIRPDRP